MTERRAPSHLRSKTVAAWLAVLGGALGLHRMYLHGIGSAAAWAHALPTALGLVGLHRLRTLGQDDRLAWLLLPLLGIGLAAAMLAAIVFALTPDERWNARYNPGRTMPPSGWGAVLAAVTALLVGGTALMGAVAYGGQKFFEWQLEAAALQALPLRTAGG